MCHEQCLLYLDQQILKPSLIFFLFSGGSWHPLEKDSELLIATSNQDYLVTVSGTLKGHGGAARIEIIHEFETLVKKSCVIEHEPFSGVRSQVNNDKIQSG